MVAIIRGLLRSRFIGLFLLSVLLFSAFCGCADAQTEPPRKAMLYNLSGDCVGRPIIVTTFDRSNNLLSGTDVVVYLRNALIASVTTDRNGNANFTLNETGTYTLRLTRARFKGFEDTFNVTDCGSCSDGIRNQDETGVDCGGLCAVCTTTTTTTSTTSTTTTTTSTTSTTRRTTTTQPTTTTTTTTTSTTTTTLPAPSGGLDLGIIGVVVFLVLVVAAYFIYSGYVKGGPGEPDEDHPQKSSELYKKSMEIASKKPPESYSGFKDKNLEASSLSDVNKMQGAFKSREEAVKKPYIERRPPEAAAPKDVGNDKAGKLDKDFAEIEKLEGELDALKKNMKDRK